MSEKEINQGKVYTLVDVHRMYVGGLWTDWFRGKGAHPDHILACQNPEWVPQYYYKMIGKPLKKEQRKVTFSVLTTDGENIAVIEEK